MTSGGEASMFELFCQELRDHTRTIRKRLKPLEGIVPDADTGEVLVHAAHSLSGAARIMQLAAIIAGAG